MSSSNSRRNETFGFQNLSSELERQGLEVDCFLHFQIEDSPSGSSTPPSSFPRSSTPSSYSPGTSTRPSFSPGSSRSAQNLGKADCSNCKFLAEKIKTLEARIRILEGQLEMERHPENHTLESAAILHEIYNGMGNLNMEYIAPSDLLFLIFDVHYDGTFNFMPLRYENGLVCQWSLRKDNELDLATVHDFLREKTQSIILYELFFKLPECELDVGLKIIENERDLEAMYDYAHKYGKIHVYVTHGPQDLASYYVDNICFYGSGDEVKSRRKTVTKDAGNMSVEELLSWAKEEAAMASKGCDDDISVTSVVDKGKGLADKGKWLVDKGKGIMVDEKKAGRMIVGLEIVLYCYSENVGKKYVDAAQLKECLTYYSLADGFFLWFYRSSKEMLIARCGMIPEKLKEIENEKQRKHIKYPSGGRNESPNCPFRCYVNYKWIAKHFRHKIRQNPKIKLHEIADLVLKKYKCLVNPSQCRYAKTKALNEGEIATEEHYAMIRSYGKKILESNDGSTVKLGVTVNPYDKTYFDSTTSANLGDFVSVRCKGTTIATTSRGRVGVKRGRGGKTVGLGVRCDNHDLSRLDNQSIERDRLIEIGFVLDFVEFISFTFGDKEMISMIEAVSR
ncbi:hypothetical protein Tco_1500940 [Tanacetum coccineum]